MISRKRKICVVTGTRAEYGLLYWLLKEIQAADDLEFQMIVTGMHLSPEFGLTYQQVEQDGFSVDKKIELLLSSDSEVGISKSIGVGIISFADALNELLPDIMVVLGDRFEIFSAVSAAMIAKIPIAHLHGGESTEGLIDESIRHSITKMSHLHFTATEAYRSRVIQLGEQPERVFNVGAAGIDNIKRLTLLSRIEFEKAINFQLGKRNLMVTFHPVTLESSTAGEQFSNLLCALDKFSDVRVIFTKANADTNGRIINNMIDQYVADNSGNCIAFTSLGQLRYLSAMQFIDGVLGNSSSGLLEVPSFKVGTVNIGDRQRGRIKAESVIDCCPTSVSITAALKRLFSEDFKGILELVDNPYGTGGAADKVVKVLRDYPLEGILKKQFYDLPYKTDAG
jgi:GDP/UDP-N,N'-diacetylbacillosamine 2-epimerase (hydrolysing)